jgi:hypothetical protein
MQLAHEAFLSELNRSELAPKYVLASKARTRQSGAQQDQAKQNVVEVHVLSEAKFRALLRGHCALHRFDFVLDPHELIAVGAVAGGNLKARDEGAAPVNEFVTHQG